MDRKYKLSVDVTTPTTNKTHGIKNSMENLGANVGQTLDHAAKTPERVLSSTRTKTVQTRAKGARTVQHIGTKLSERIDPDNQ